VWQAAKARISEKPGKKRTRKSCVDNLIRLAVSETADMMVHIRMSSVVIPPQR